MGRVWGDTPVQNSFHGDIHEGMVAVFIDPKECDALEGADPNFVKDVKAPYYVDSIMFSILIFINVLYLWKD